jgi:UDP-N-acetylmuramoylalanine-D-glutamate ligase
MKAKRHINRRRRWQGTGLLTLREAVAKNARAVVLIGRDAGIIANELKECGVPLHFAVTMEEAIQKSFCWRKPAMRYCFHRLAPV